MPCAADRFGPCLSEQQPQVLKEIAKRLDAHALSNIQIEESGRMEEAVPSVSPLLHCLVQAHYVL
jgi:hypothetical protein